MIDRATVNFTAETLRTAETIAAEYSTDLGIWTPAAAGDDIVISEFNDAYGVGIDRVEVKIRRTLAVNGKLFVRLNVAVTQP